MKLSLLPWTRFLLAVLPVLVVLSISATANAQFRDITPRPDSEPGEPLTPEPLSPQPLPAEELEPQPVPAAPMEDDVEEIVDDAEAAVEREQALQEEIENTLVDDTEIRPLPFRGITAGKSTEEDVYQKWGEPFREMDGQRSRLLKYRLDPFRQVDVTILGNKVASILIHLDGLLSQELVEQELRMTKLQPAPVLDEIGMPVGLAYPERGVLLGYDSRDRDALVAKIQLEPVTPEPFVLRAKNDRHHQHRANLADLRTALDLNSNYSEAHYIRAQQFAETGRFQDALASVTKATSLQPENTLYAMARIQMMAENGNRETALRETKLMLEQPELDSDIESALRSTMGELVAFGLAGKHKAAMQHHLDAIDVASKLVNDPVRDIRLRAKETLIRSHLAIARNISMGDFQKQQTVVPKWLSRSRALIDEYVKNEGGDRIWYLDLYRQIMATASDIRNPEDPAHVISQLTNESRKLIAAAHDELRKQNIEWKLGAGLAEAVRLQRQRGKADEALKLADDAMRLLKGSAKHRQSTPEQTYLIGRLYFHIGSLHAVQRGDHDEAIMWYKKAEPLLADEQPTALLADPGTHGEMFVSMGVSYWDYGDRQKAIDITEFGTDYLQRAVVEGLLDTDVLTIPYGNLATMHMKNGNEQEAKAFAELAAEIESETLVR